MREECLPGGRTIAERVSAPAAGGAKHKGLRPLTILVHGNEVKQGEVSEENADRLPRFDFEEQLRPRVSPRSCRFHVCGPRPATSQAAFEQPRLL